MTTVAAPVSYLQNTKALSLRTPGTGSNSLQFSPSPMPLRGDPPGVGIQVEW